MAANSSICCTRLLVTRGFNCRMTSGATYSRISSETSIRSSVFTSPGHSADAADHSRSCDDRKVDFDDECNDENAPPLTRRPEAASATTAHPSVLASSAAARALEASPPPATTSKPFRADLINAASSLKSAKEEEEDDDDNDEEEDDEEDEAWGAPAVNGAEPRSHPSKPRKSRRASHSASDGPSGSRNWQLTCTGPGRGPCRCRTAVATAVAATRAGEPSPGGARSTPNLA